MARIPAILLFFFASAAVLTGYGAVEMRRPGPPFAASGASSLEEQHRERGAEFASGWPKTPAFAVAFNALGALAPPDKTSGDPDRPGEAVDLPQSDGRELVVAHCGARHSLGLVAQQRITPERWDYLLDWMVSEQNMPPFDAVDRERITAYLTRHFSPL